MSRLFYIFIPAAKSGSKKQPQGLPFAFIMFYQKNP